ncbi:unnamed protein product [Camellia sinensis]
MKRLSEEAGAADDGNSNSEDKIPRQKKKVRVLDPIGEEFGCSEEPGMEIQRQENQGTGSQVICVQQSSSVVEGIRAFCTIDLSDSEEPDRGIEGCQKNHHIIDVEEFFLEEARVLRGSEGCGNGDRGEEEIDKGDHGRDLGNMGPITACGNSNRNCESIMMVDHGTGKENSSWDLNLGQMEFDLNLPAMEADEGGSERGLHEHTLLGPVIAQRVDIIHISSDESEDEDQKLPDERDARRKGKEIDEGFADESNGSVHMGSVTLELGTSSDGCVSMSSGKRYTREEKGKAKLVDPWLSLAPNLIPFDSRPGGQELIRSADSGGIQLNETNHPEETIQVRGTENLEFRREPERRIVRAPQILNQRADANRYREIARHHASRLAVPNSQQEDPQESFNKEMQMQPIEAGKKFENFLGPFYTEMKLIKERNMKHSPQKLIIWKPSKDRDHNISMPSVPLLLDLSLEVLAKNAEAIVSLEHIPDALKHRLTDLLCDSRKMNIHALDLLVQGSPTEIRIKDCSWITEEQFTKRFGSFDPKNLKVDYISNLNDSCPAKRVGHLAPQVLGLVLQLDLCGQCLLGGNLVKTLARSPNSLPDLAIISLKGACRLTDIALKELLVSAPALQSINLSQCSLLSNTGIDILADSVGAILKELYIDNCQRIDAMLIAPVMKKFKHLEVLSVAGIQTVCDEFLTDIIPVCGRNLKELDLAGCLKLTDISTEVIGNTCPGMCSLNISNLHKLTDLSMQYLANGCQSIQTLKLRQNSFSDEAIAAFLEASGKSLKELSLNNVRKLQHQLCWLEFKSWKHVGPNTALSLAKCSKELLSLDLSWCRKITNEALGLIVDSCLSLKLLKIFGCTQIGDEFLYGHSNSLVQIIGCSMTPVLDHLNILEPDKALLRYSPLTFSSHSPSSDH